MAYTPNLIPDMTSNTAPKGTASASTEFSSTYAAWKAMDKDSTTFWSTTTGGVTPCWLEYEFDNSIIITKYTITARDTASDGAPNTWTFEGYNGSTWDTLDTQSSITFTNGEKKEYTFSNETDYTRYRIYVTANNGRSSTNIAEMEMMTEASEGTDTYTEYTGTDEFGSKTTIQDFIATQIYSTNFVDRTDGKLLIGYSKSGTHYVSNIDSESDLGTADITTNEASFGSGYEVGGSFEQYSNAYTESMCQFFKTSTGKIIAFTYDPGRARDSSGAGTAGTATTVRYHESSNGLGTDFGTGSIIYTSDDNASHLSTDSTLFYGLQYMNLAPCQEIDGTLFITFGGSYKNGSNQWIADCNVLYSTDDGDTWSWTTFFQFSPATIGVKSAPSGVWKAGNVYYTCINVRTGLTSYATRFYFALAGAFDNWISLGDSSNGYNTRAMWLSSDGYVYWYFYYSTDTDSYIYRRLANDLLDTDSPYDFGTSTNWEEQYSSSTTFDAPTAKEYLTESSSGNIIDIGTDGDIIYYYTTDRTATDRTATGEPYTGDYLIEIGGEDYTLKTDFKDATWTNVENFSNSASITVVDDSNFIKMGQELIIRRQSDSKVVFGGLIQEPKKVLISPSFVMVKVYAENYKQILGRRTFQLSEQNTDAGTIVQGIFDDYLKVGGTFTDEGFVLGNIDTGATIENYVKRAQSGLKLFNDLADASDYKWWVTNTKDFYFQATPTYVDNTATKKLTPDKTDSAYIKCIDLPDFTEDSSKFRTRQNVIGKKIDGAFVFGSYTDSTAESEMASRYGSGVFGATMVNDNISTTAEADALAQSEVETYVNPAVIRFKTTDFIEPLELITVDISILGISAETYKVTQVTYKFDNDVRIVCDVTCEKYQTTNKQKRSWTDEFNEMIKSNTSEGEKSDYTYIDNVGVVNLAPAVPYLSTLTHILDADLALHCHYSIVGVSTGAGTVTVTFDINTVVQKTFTFDVVAGNFCHTLAYPIRGIATSGSATIDASTTSTVAIAIAINDLNFWVKNE